MRSAGIALLLIGVALAVAGCSTTRTVQTNPMGEVAASGGPDRLPISTFFGVSPRHPVRVAFHSGETLSPAAASLSADSLFVSRPVGGMRGVPLQNVKAVTVTVADRPMGLLEGTGIGAGVALAVGAVTLGISRLAPGSQAQSTALSAFGLSLGAPAIGALFGGARGSTTVYRYVPESAGSGR